MKIATYNVWESTAGFPLRFRHIMEEIRAADADVLCLQEVEGPRMHRLLAEDCGYPYSAHHDRAGLSVLSRFPLSGAREYEYGLSARAEMSGCTLLIADVHLPWKSALERERAIAETVGALRKEQADYSLLLGDFNCSDSSSVHHFLLGDCSLHSEEAYYFDMAEAYASLTGMPAPATLNFRENPRWGVYQERNTIEKNQRFDRVYLANPYPKRYPELLHVSLFGTKVYEETGLCASDHYGVLAELEF